MNFSYCSSNLQKDNKKPSNLCSKNFWKVFPGTNSSISIDLQSLPKISFSVEKFVPYNLSYTFELFHNLIIRKIIQKLQSVSICQLSKMNRIQFTLPYHIKGLPIKVETVIVMPLIKMKRYMLQQRIQIIEINLKNGENKAETVVGPRQAPCQVSIQNLGKKFELLGQVLWKIKRMRVSQEQTKILRL